MNILNENSANERVFIQGGKAVDSGERAPKLHPRREQKKQQDRHEILAAAAALFAADGYEGASMQMIAERAGLSVGTIYLHFAGKEEIYRQAVEYHAGLLRERIEAQCDPDLPPLELLRARLRTALGYIEENAGFIRFYLSETGDGRASCHHERVYVEHLRASEALLRAAIERGEIPPDEDPLLLAGLIYGAVYGLMKVVLQHGRLSLGAVAGVVDRIILAPLERRAEASRGEDRR